MNISQQWLDKIVAAAIPATTNTQGVCDIIEAIEGKRPAKNTVRRWEDLKYRIRGRERTYEVDDVIAKARKRLLDAPVRRAAVSRHRAAKTDHIPTKK
jgi:hypothetical protein